MTEETKIQLEMAGLEVRGTLTRFMNNEAMYERFLLKYPTDQNYQKMLDSLETKNYREAYKFAHALKGVTGNLGFTDIYQELAKIVKILKETDNIESQLPELQVRLTKLNGMQKDIVALISNLE
ncbi:MAG TPA: hypothetical protein PLZ77_10470 [Lachnospiraceae bacterium]|nr:hypothetical protein [Lachnospiraceae bacterium]HPF30508.1 hypothetical protein [Lachnospiraceae bacterium]